MKKNLKLELDVIHAIIVTVLDFLPISRSCFRSGILAIRSLTVKFVNTVLEKVLLNLSTSMKNKMPIRAFWSIKFMNRSKIPYFMWLISIICIYYFFTGVA